MKKVVLYILAICSIQNIFSRDIAFSDSIDFSVLTVSPGTELYSVFGHSAIRFTDYKYGYDYVFNYGTFDFQTRGFYFKFALGRLDYRLSVESFEDFMASCQYENRSVTAQKLNLTLEQKKNLLFALIQNYQPQNRYYRYKFFTDNCATRIRDILQQTLPGLQWNKLEVLESGTTFRELYRRYLVSMPWTLTGIEFLMGPMADQPAGYDVMFLPDKLKQAIDSATINQHPLLVQQSILFQASPLNIATSSFTPFGLAILLLIISFAVQPFKRFARLFDTVFFTITGGLGSFILVLSLASAHRELHYNLVVLYFLPFLLLLPWVHKPQKRLVLLYGSITITGCACLLLPWLPQHINATTCLIAISIIIRLIFNILEIKYPEYKGWIEKNRIKVK